MDLNRRVLRVCVVRRLPPYIIEVGLELQASPKEPPCVGYNFDEQPIRSTVTQMLSVFAP
jgi:hypothetical protein